MLCCMYPVGFRRLHLPARGRRAQGRGTIAIGLITIRLVLHGTCHGRFWLARVDEVVVMQDENGEQGCAPPTNTSGCTTAKCFQKGGGSGHWVVGQDARASGIAASYVQGWPTMIMKGVGSI